MRLGLPPAAALDDSSAWFQLSHYSPSESGIKQRHVMTREPAKHLPGPLIHGEPDLIGDERYRLTGSHATWHAADLA